MTDITTTPATPAASLYRDDSYPMWVVVADGAEEAPTDEAAAIGRVQTHMQAGKTTVTLLLVTVRETRAITERPDA